MGEERGEIRIGKLKKQRTKVCFKNFKISLSPLDFYLFTPLAGDFMPCRRENENPKKKYDAK